MKNKTKRNKAKTPKSKRNNIEKNTANKTPNKREKFGRFLDKKDSIARKNKKENKLSKKDELNKKTLAYATKIDDIILNFAIFKNTRRFFSKIAYFIKRRFSKIKFEIFGLNVTKLINLLKTRKIPLSKVSITDNGLTFTTEGKYYEKTKKILCETGYEYNAEVLSKTYKFLQVINAKKLFATTLVCLGIFYLVSSCLLLKISINLEVENVTKLLESNGIKIGVSLKNIDEKKLESILLKNMDLSFCDVRLTGNTLYVKVTKSPEITKPTIPSPDDVIVANTDCILSRQLIYSGTAVKKFGDVIKKGDVLVLNKIFVDDNLSLPVIASGDVYGLIQKKSVVTIPKTRKEKVFTGKIKKITTLGLNKKFKTAKSPFTFFESSEKVCLVSTILPLYKRTITYKEFKYATVTYDENKVVNDIYKKEKEKLANSVPLKAKISRSWFDLTFDGENFLLTSYIEYEDKVSTLSSLNNQN